jgi:hypothetical protein
MQFVYALSKFIVLSVCHPGLIKSVLTLCQTVNEVISCDTLDSRIMLQVLEDKPYDVFQHG